MRSVFNPHNELKILIKTQNLGVNPTHIAGVKRVFLASYPYLPSNPSPATIVTDLQLAIFASEHLLKPIMASFTREPPWRSPLVLHQAKVSRMTARQPILKPLLPSQHPSPVLRRAQSHGIFSPHHLFSLQLEIPGVVQEAFAMTGFPLGTTYIAELCSAIAPTLVIYRM